MTENIKKETKWLLDEKYNGKLTAEAQKDITRLANGEHVDYVIGWVNFAGCKIDLSFKPLIPRSETEYWVRTAIDDLKKNRIHNTTYKILDIFSGSGCVGIAILKHVPYAYVDFVEQDPILLRQIALNAQLNNIDRHRYSVLESDVFSGINNKYDYIFANPPYVLETQIKKVQTSVLEQEPHNAVFGGEDGLYYIRKLLRQAKHYVCKGGVVYLEFDSPQKETIQKLAKEAGASTIDTHKDQYNKWRYARIVF